MSDQNSPEETNEEILRVRHWKTLVDLAAKGRMTAKRGGIAGRSILMPVWDDVMIPGGKFTFDETPEQRAQADIERRSQAANMPLMRLDFDPPVGVDYSEAYAGVQKLLDEMKMRPSIRLDSFKYQAVSPWAVDQIASAPEAPLVNYRPTPRSKFKPGAYEYVVTTVNDLGESPASPSTKVHAFDGQDYNFVLHADPGQPRANFYRQVAGKPETRVYVGTCLAGGKVVDYGVEPSATARFPAGFVFEPMLGVQGEFEELRRRNEEAILRTFQIPSEQTNFTIEKNRDRKDGSYEIPAVVGMGSTAKISMMSPMSQGGASTIQESAAALAAGFDKVCAKPQPGETCGKCKAVVKERPLFVGIFVGCLC